MIERTIVVERATPETIAPFGHFVAARAGVPTFLSWPGVDVFGSLPIDIGTGGELLFVQMAARSFPVRCGLIERHFRHTQTYLPGNGRPFVMLLGLPTQGDLPDYDGLRAFLFDDASGIILHPDIWHDFPYALEDDTRFAVLLRAEAHVNTNTAPAYPNDADGPDLQRRAIAPRATITVALPEQPDRP